MAAGLGHALTEQVIYDESGQLITGTFMDYGAPRAHHKHSGSSPKAAR